MTWNDLLIAILSMPPQDRNEEVTTGKYDYMGEYDESNYYILENLYDSRYVLVRK